MSRTCSSIRNWPGYSLLFSALLVLLILPVWSVALVPLTDLPLHMARAYLMRHYGDGSAMVSYLELSPVPRHNAAFDLLVPPLLGSLSLERATQWFLTLYLLLFAAACHWLGRAVSGDGTRFGPPRPAMLPCLFLSCHGSFLYGYVNFSFGLALALLALALRIGWGRRWTVLRIAILTALCTLIYLSHLAALGILGLAWVLWTLHECFQARRICLRDAAAFAAFIPAAALYFFTLGEPHGAVAWAGPRLKLLHSMAGFTSYSLPITMLAASLGMATLAAGLWFSRHTLRRPVFALGAVFLALFLLSPDAFHNATDTDVRFVPPALILAAAAISFPTRAGRLPVLLLAISLAVMTARHVDIALAWRRAGQEMRAQLPSLDVIEPGALVYKAVWIDPNPAVNKRQRHFLHFPALSIPRRHSLYPELSSSAKGTWPLHARPDYYYRYLEPGESFTHLDWDRLRTAGGYFWTYGLTPAALAELAPYTSKVYESGPVRVFRIQAKSL